MKGDDAMNLPTQSRPAFRAGRRRPLLRSAYLAQFGITPLQDDEEYGEDDMGSANESDMADEGDSEA
jgi:hypothetical protein